MASFIPHLLLYPTCNPSHSGIPFTGSTNLSEPWQAPYPLGPDALKGDTWDRICIYACMYIYISNQTHTESWKSRPNQGPSNDDSDASSLGGVDLLCSELRRFPLGCRSYSTCGLRRWAMKGGIQGYRCSIVRYRV